MTDLLHAAPESDAGTVPNLRFSFADAHRRMERGGWAREVTRRELPVATALAGVNMRLEPCAVRELHWHKQAEWAYMLEGRARITAMDADGRPFADDVGGSDLWYFPPGIPHAIQALGEGCEFLLVFDDGDFSESATFLLTDWLAHTPAAVLAQNLGVPEDELDRLPDDELYIFPGTPPGPLAASGGRRDAPRFSHRLLDGEPLRMPGGTVRIADSRTFPVATRIAAVLVEVEPGAVREMHWHPNADEWQYYLDGTARMTVFAAEGRARTFEFGAGDVGYVPLAMGHYVENTGRSTLRFLELFAADRFVDVSLSRWLAHTAPELVHEHLHLRPEALRALHRGERPVID